ncbi:MAG: bifunctional 23S rRNA (guanine(2069)-N(7))-methyltransferase RlmK/23S rRNA (guanine(2445)-N(2))-methyltransferase RlmL [Planctomycetaceae bacterium]|nr:bifunctional 23S rRNA (guanine(2069)-N(7))-methyltransferase RlmK/23S rRNA (guanine(2445)-N(2))-methyltransferase RlmL [Planctomycetaceae bacterium]
MQDQLKLTAACAFGLEAIVKRELIALGYTPSISQPGRVDFAGDWAAVCRTNLWLRTADRVLIEVQKFDAPDFDALFDTVKEFDWSQFIPADAAFPVIGRSRLSQLTSVPAVQRSVKRSIVESLLHYHDVNSLPESGAEYKVEIALLNDVATLTIDTTGPSLHKRGYRKLVAEAPLKETLSAALVSLSVWNPERPLIDPFCGSGTIAIEAALQGLNIAPGINRSFTSKNWEIIPDELWEQAVEEAKDLEKKTLRFQIIGTDRDKEVLSLARYHSQQAGVADYVHFQNRDFDQLTSKREYGCIITNPPYGERLEDQERLLGLYRSIPAIMQRLPTWSLFLITNMPKFEAIIQKSATRRRKLFNGRLECTYYQFLGPRPPRGYSPEDTATSLQPLDTELELPANPQIPSPTETAAPVNHNHSADTAPPSSQTPSADSSVTPSTQEQLELRQTSPSISRSQPIDSTVLPLFGGLHPKDREQAGLLANRLKKRAKHLRRWPTKRNITCFRIYERDIPEIPLVIDRYEDHLHITEYDRPHDRDLARHGAWLELMKTTASETLEIPLTHTHLKKRRRSNSFQQYEKIASSGKLITVHEGGMKFAVNLVDYVDTGLFLDHRTTRKMVQAESSGKDFLNLFAYTGSFSVYAVKGGATRATTVDLSKNYLDWAKQNFQLNGIDPLQHQFVAQDSIDFLETAAEDKRKRFDLAIVDPPTFSNSKQTELDWDVQERHCELLEKVHGVMRLGGVVYFSTNFRRFKFDDQYLGDLFEIREISKQTVPEDFRNRRIHRCWRLVVKW